MRHRAQVKHFSRSPNARKALVRGLVSSLVEHERIKTTVPKAKELRRHIERAITAGRKGDLATTRTLLAKFPNRETVSKIVNDLSVRFKDRPGGYTRILKLGARAGDGAPMAFIEFVDYDPTKTTDNKTYKVKTKDAKRKQVIKEMTADERDAYQAEQAAKAAAAKRKRVRKMQEASRKINR